MARGLLENEAELSKRQLHLLMQVSTIFNSSLDFYAVIQSVLKRPSLSLMLQTVACSFYTMMSERD